MYQKKSSPIIISNYIDFNLSRFEYDMLSSPEFVAMY